MTSAAAPPPIAGTAIDPPPKPVPAYAERLDRSTVGGIAYRALRRYSYAKVGLLAAGTAYYLFLALLSLLAFAYGIIAIVGADELSQALTDSLSEALPGLVGPEGIDPAQLRATGAAAGTVGLLLMLYSSLNAVSGASSSLHIIFGAPPDPRSFLPAKLRALGLLVPVATLVLLSFLALGAASGVVTPVLSALGIEGTAARLGIVAAGLLVGFGIDVLILWILLGTLGGIRPDRRPRLGAALIGALGVAVVKQLLNAIVSWSLDKPQYGAFAIPLAILFVLSLLSTVLYASAAIAAGISDAEVPLGELEAT